MEPFRESVCKLTIKLGLSPKHWEQTVDIVRSKAHGALRCDGKGCSECDLFYMKVDELLTNK